MPKAEDRRHALLPGQRPDGAGRTVRAPVRSGRGHRSGSGTLTSDRDRTKTGCGMPRMPVFFYGFGPGRRRDGPAGTEAREGWQCPLRGGVFWPGCPGAGIRPESRGTIGTVRRSVLVEKDSACRWRPSGVRDGQAGKEETADARGRTRQRTARRLPFM